MSTREEFEEWAKSEGYSVQTLDRFNAYPPHTYSDSRTHAAWNGWIAATKRVPMTDEQIDSLIGVPVLVPVVVRGVVRATEQFHGITGDKQ